MNSPNRNAPLDPSRSRTVRIGGLSKQELLDRLGAAGVQMNDHARALFAQEGFTTRPGTVEIEIVEVSVAELGCPRGAVMAEVYARAVALGLEWCPLEVGPHLRLVDVDQPEGHLGFPPTEHRAPPGSLTVASRELARDDAIPKGFYLRRIAGTLWLRGYRADGEHVWSGDDRLVFFRRRDDTSRLCGITRR